MPEGCVGNCLVCGRCARKDFSIMESIRVPSPPDIPRAGAGAAVDLGTTTVVMALLDLTTGEILGRHSFMNPQRIYGADVITRIGAANNGALEKLRESIVQAVVSGIRTLTDTCGVPVSQLRDVVIAGNTVMIYLLLGMPCRSLGVFPFKPEYPLKDMYTFTEVFGAGDIECGVRIVPWLTAFVGGDITSGLLVIEEEPTDCFLLIDLGTNGEMALAAGGRLIVTSTAAGPAFEGGTHKGGASAVLDALADLLRCGTVDRTGRLAQDAPAVFSQKEIRDLQLAKSAVRCGFELLLQTAGIALCEIEKIFLAGGIGQAVNAGSAVATGLLPAQALGKIQAAGNTSLDGAVKMLLNPDDETARALADKAEELLLSAHPLFNGMFSEYMFF